MWGALLHLVWGARVHFWFSQCFQKLATVKFKRPNTNQLIWQWYSLMFCTSGIVTRALQGLEMEILRGSAAFWTCRKFCDFFALFENISYRGPVGYMWRKEKTKVNSSNSDRRNSVLVVSLNILRPCVLTPSPSQSHGNTMCVIGKAVPACRSSVVLLVFSHSYWPNWWASYLNM